MSNHRKSKAAAAGLSRRDFVKVAGMTAAASAAGLVSARARAEELAKLDEKDPAAAALSYVSDATTVDAAKRPADRFCNNCALFAGTADDAYAGCQIFPGKAVSGKGWCSVWAPKG
ncbi:MAG: high-potential iron-sulfur protein [Pseudomonadota bacterium]